MGYDLFWSFVIFAILISAIIYYGISEEPAKQQKAEESGERAERGDGTENPTVRSDTSGTDAGKNEQPEEERK